MFEAAKKAGLGPADFARLVKVSRVTASMWFNGRAKPHYLLQIRVDAVLAAIQVALERQELPAPEGMRKQERNMYIARVVEKSIKPA